MAKIKKTWSDAGSLPGQYQKVEVEFISRSGHNVKVKWYFYAKSNGYDNYDFKSRHNRARIYSGKDTVRDTYDYQAKGNKASKSHSETFTITGVGNTTTELGFWYSNQRMWPGGTNSWDPRSTGVVSKTKVGGLSIPANKKYTITFNEVVNNQSTPYTCYNTDSFTIPNLNPTNPYYTFYGWTSWNYASSYAQGSSIPNSVLEKATVQMKSGNSISSVTSNLTYYAVWRPKTCKYNFYDYDGNLITSVTHTYGTYTKLPNIDTDDSYAKYKVPGYNFTGWHVGSKTGKLYNPDANCAEWDASGVNFYPEKSPQLNIIDFKIPDNEKLYDYRTDAIFNMFNPLSDSGITDLTKAHIMLKPGYKLVGWSTVPPRIMAKTYSELSAEGYAFPNEGYNLSGLKKASNGYYYVGDGVKIYPISGDVQFNYDDFVPISPPVPGYDGNQLNLYPYYEYYTTTYVYHEGEWKLAMPYIYKDGKWNMALSYIYDNGTWKL